MSGTPAPGFAIICYSLCLLALWIPAFFFANKWGQEAIDKQLYSFAVLNQIGRDWQRPPYSDIIVTEEYLCPDTHPETVVTRPWYGVDLGCDCLGIGEYSSGYNLEGNGDRIRQAGICTRN